MRKRWCTTKGVVLVLAVLGSSTPARADDQLVAEVPFTMGFGTHAILTFHFVTICEGLSFDCERGTELDFGELGNANAGQTLWADSTAVNFDGLAAVVTNGVPDVLDMHFDGAGPEMPESIAFAGQSGPLGVDLAGYTVHRIGFRIDDISIQSPGSDPNHDGLWTDESIAGAFLFEATCSEPPTIETLRPITVAGACHGETTISLCPPAAGSLCKDDPSVTGRIVSSTPPVPLIDGRVSLPPGTYTIEWTVDDGFATASSTQMLTVERRCRPVCSQPGHRRGP